MERAAIENFRTDPEHLRAVLDAASDAYLCGDESGVIVDCNRTAERLFGWSTQELLGSAIWERVIPDRFRGQYLAFRERLLAEGISRQQVALTLRCRDGREIEPEGSFWTTGPAGQRLLHVLLRDVGDRYQLQRELVRRSKRLAEAQRIAGVGSWEWDLVTDEEEWSPEMYRIYGVERGVEPSYQVFLDRLHPEDRERVQRLVETMAGDRQPLQYEARIVRPDGETRWIAVRGEVTDRAPDGAALRKAGTVQDITAQKAAEAALETRALTDTLTGLGNRERFSHVLTAALEETQAAGQVGVLLLDLDGFKDVNDGIGHHAGDLVLQEVARRVTAVIRGGDELARLGGDEFAVVLPTIGSVEDAIAVAGNIRACLEPPFDLDGITVHVGASVGIVASPGDGRDVGTLLKKADVAMYRAKTLPSGLAVFEGEQDDVAADRLSLVNDLRAAIRDGAITVAYQPIVETRTRRVSAFEALARWHHPERGDLPPDRFVPLAEQADLIGPLTELVLRKAAAACVAWRADGHDVSVGVNVSVPAMETSGVVDFTARVLEETGLDPRCLVLEITETAVAVDAHGVQDVLRKLRELGVRLVIDDFGTGYSAMSYLKDLPVQELKIDRSFVRDITTDSRDLSIVRSLTRLAHSLSLRVVAEGAETLPAVEVLAGIGCDFVQGYGIARPMPEKEVVAWLAQHHSREMPAVGPAPCDLLIVDDSPVVRAHLAALAERAGWHIREVGSATEAIAEVEQRLPDVVILDHHLPGGLSGVEAVPELRRRGYHGPILLFTQFLTDALPSIRVPLDVWPVAKSNPDAIFELLDAYRTSIDV